MSAQSAYLTSIFTSFSTFLAERGVVDATAHNATLALAALIENKTDWNSWDVQRLAVFWQTTAGSHHATEAQALVTAFVRRYPPTQINVFLHEFCLALKVSGCSHSTVKNYRSDISQFAQFAEKHEISELITKPKVLDFLRQQREAGLKHSSIRRKLVSVQQFALWAVSQSLIPQPQWFAELFSALENAEPLEVLDVAISSPKPAVSASARAAATIASVPVTAGQLTTPTLENTALSPMDHQERRAQLQSSLTRLARKHLGKPGLQGGKSAASWALTALVLLVSLIGIGFFGYQQFLLRVSTPFAYPSTPTRPNRQLSFQGRLTDTVQNPITTATDMRFYLYDSGPTTGSGAQLWDSGTCSVTPDQDGIFSVGLGDDCGTEITEDVFSENSNVWLEVEIDSETLDPRQAIQTVPYALNSETLQGYPIDASGAATINTVVTMNSGGEIVLGEVSPTIRSTSGTFSLEAQTLSLETSSGSDGDIILSPDGTGEVQINADTVIDGYLYAPGATLSATYAGGTALVTRGGPTGTGNIQEWQNSAGTALTVVDESGNIGIGTSNPNAKIRIDTATATNVGIILNSTDGSQTQNLQEWKTSGTTYGKMTSTGGLGVQGLAVGTTTLSNGARAYITTQGSSWVGLQVVGVSGQTADLFQLRNSTPTTLVTVNASGNLGIASTSPAEKLDVAGNFRLTGTTTLNSLTYTWPASQTNGYVLSTNGSGTLSWSDPAVLAGGTNLWDSANGAIYPKNATLDLLVGGTATTSAKFAVTNVNSGTPTATISAGVTGGTYLNSLGKLATTAMQNLTLGDTSTTGDVIINPSRNVGIGTTNANHRLTVGSSETPIGTAATLGVYNAGSGYMVFRDSTNNIETALGTTTSGNVGYSGTFSAHDYRIIVGNSVWALTAQATTGNIGIGDTTPTQLFTVGSGDLFQVNSLGEIVKIDGVAHTITDSAGDISINSNGGSLLLADTDTLVVGGLAGAAYNAFSDSGTAGFAASDDDLYIEDILEVDGATYLEGAATVTGILTANGTLDLNGTRLILDADADTSITADLDDQIDIEIAGADDFSFLANAFHALSGSTINVNSGATLDVNGDISIADTNISLDGASTTFTQTTGAISFAPAAGTNLNVNLSTTGDFVVNTDDLYVDTSSGNVGIGTTAPTSQLHVYSTAPNLRLESGGANNISIALVNSTYNSSILQRSTGQLDISNQSNEPIRFSGSGTSWMDMDGNGLTINAQRDLRLADSDSSHYLAFQAPATVSSNITYTFPGSLTNGYILQTDGSGVLTWADPAVIAGASILWDSTNGAIYPKNSTLDLLVGGTATTSAKFAVTNINAGVPTATMSAGVNGGLYLTADGTIATTALQTLSLGSSTTGNVTFAPAGAVAATILQNGNFGIGSTNPQQKLDVNAGTTDSVATFRSSDNLARFDVRDNDTAGFLVASDNLFSLGGENTLHANNINISTVDGNVGIGVTAATQRLDVVGEIELSNYLYFGNGSTEYLRWDGSDFLLSDDLLPIADGGQNLGSSSARWESLYIKGSSLHIGDNGNDAIVGYDTTGNYLSFDPDGDTTAEVVISDAGNIGIGSLSPGAALDVVGDVYISSGLSTFNSAVSEDTIEATTFCTGDGESNCVSDFSVLANGSGIWSSSNGAIYPTNSTRDLLVGGTATTSAKFGFINVDSGTPTATISANLSLKVPTGSTPATTLNILNGGTFNLLSATSGQGDAGLSSRLFMTNTGNFGIGSTSPATQLDVSGNITVSDPTGGGGNLYIEDNNAVTGRLDASSNVLYLISSATSSQLQLRTTNSGGSAVDAMRVDSNGNIGIGDTSPTQLFTVGTGDLFQVNSSGEIVKIDGVAHTVTDSAGDISINSNGGSLLLADTDTLVVGGLAGAAYNAFSDSGTAGLAASDDDLFIEDILEVDGSLYVGSGGIQITNILDEDNMVSNSATALATQQSIKAYVDTQILASVPNFDEIYAQSITDGNLTMEIDSTTGLTFNMDTTGTFNIQDNATTYWSFDDDSTVDVSFPAAGQIGIDAATTDSTLTSGVIDLNVDTVTTNNIGLNVDHIIRDSAGITAYGARINQTIDTDASHSSTGYGLYITTDNDDASSTITGLYVDADGDGGGTGTAYAAAFMDGFVGIGSAAPSAPLTIASSAGNSATGAILSSFVSSYTGGSTQIANNFSVQIPDSASSAYTALRGNAQTGSGNPYSAAGLTGFDGSVFYQASSGTVTTATGGRMTISTAGGGSITNAYAMNISALSNGSSGNIGDARGINIAAFANSGGGVISTAYGMYIGSQTVATNNYGLWGDAGDWILDEDGSGASGGTTGGGDIILGEGQDLELYHDGTNSYIMNNTGDLYIGDAATDDIILSNNGGNVGITTTNPTAKLHIVGGSGVTARVDTTGAGQSAKFELSEAGTSKWQFSNFGSSNDILVISGDGGLGVDDFMTINQTGNVGIGDTSPTYLLDVAGTGRFTGAVDLDADLELNSTLTDVNGSVGTSGQVLSSTATGVDWIDATSSYSSWTIADDDTDTYSVVDGNILRFTSSDSNVLTNLANGDDGDENMDFSIRLLGDAVAGAGLTGGADNVLVGADADVTFTIGAGNGITANADDVAVNEAYNFAWTGTHSWSNTADFNGNISIADTNISLDGTSTTFTQTTGAISFAPAAGTNMNFTLSGAGDFIVNTNDLVVDTSTGNIGIGSTTPAAALDVVGDIYVSSGLSTFNTAVSNGTIEATQFCTGDGETNCVSDFSTLQPSGWTDDGATVRLTTAADYISIGSTTNDGKVGIDGARVGQALLMLNEEGDQNIFTASASGTTQAFLTRTGDMTAARFSDYSDSAYYLNPADSTTSLLVLGNVGIGTTTASQKLHVTSGTTDSVATFRSSDDTARIDVQDDDSTGYFGVKDAFTFVGGTNTLSTNNLTINNTNGNLGLGTTSPIAKLHVTGANAAATTGTTPNGSLLVNNGDVYLSVGIDGNAPYSWLQSRNGTVATYYSLMLNPNGGNVGIGTTTASQVFHVNSSTTDSVATFRSSDDTARIDVQDNDTSSFFGVKDSFAFLGGTNTISANNLTINTSNGNLGLGATAPSQKLDVAGEIELANYLYFDNAATEYLRWNGSDFLLTDDFLPVGASQGIGSLSAYWGTAYLGSLDISDGAGNAGIIQPLTSDMLSFGEFASYDFKDQTLTSFTTLSAPPAAGASGTILNIKPALTAMNGSDIVSLLSLTPTNANHTTGSNFLYGINVAGISGDAQATEVGLLVDTGWDIAAVLNGNVGIGDSTPDAGLEILGTTEQLRLTHTDGVDDTSFTVDTSGNLTIDNSGTKTMFADDIQVTGNDILDSGATTRLSLGATTTLTNTATTLSGTATLTASSLSTLTTSSSLLLGSTTTLTMGGSATFYGGGAANDDLAIHGTSNATRTTSYVNIQPTAGNVGIGTTAPAAILDLRGPMTTDGSLSFQSIIANNTTAYNASPVSGIMFYNQYTSGGAYAGMGGISVGKLSATDGNYSSYMALHTRVNGSSVAERVRIASDGNVGIGTTGPNRLFHVSGSLSSNSMALIDNTDTTDNTSNAGLHIRTGATATTTQKRFIVFSASATNVGRIRLNNGNVAYESGGADFAEYFTVNTPNEPGDIIAATNKTAVTGEPIVGVVSDTAAFVGNAKTEAPLANQAIVGFIGQVATKVSTANGVIKKGDPITAGQIPGVGVKATGAGTIVGRALEDFNNSDPNAVQKISVYINPSWFDPNITLNTAGLLEIQGTNSSNFTASVDGTPVNKRAAYSEAVIAKLTAGLTTTKDLVVQQSAQIANLSVTNVTIAGQSLRNFVAGVVRETIQNEDLVSPLAQVTLDENESFTVTNPSGTTVASIDATGKTKLGDLIVTGDASVSGTITSARLTALGELAAGSASISGELVAETITAATISAESVRLATLEGRMAEFESIKAQTADLVNATVSGTLYANNIDGFGSKVAAAFDEPSLLEILLQKTGQSPAATESAAPGNLADLHETISKVGIDASSSAELNLTLANLELTTEDATLTASAAFINDYLKVNGSAYINNSLAVRQNLFVGEGMQIADGLIEYTAAPDEAQILAIQPSGKGTLSLLAGLMELNENGQINITGNLAVAGDVKVEGSLLSNLLQPTEYGNPFQVQVAGIATESGQVKESRFEIVNELGSPVATISAQGRAAFAGGIGIGSESLGAAGSETDSVTANKTSGKAKIAANFKEVIIKSELLTGSSLIYVTPVGSTENKVLYVKSQTAENKETGDKEGQFVVGFDEAIGQEVEFNWWVVN